MTEKNTPPLNPADHGYSGWSVFWHWMGATLVTVLFLSHEFEPGGDAEWVHVKFGALAGVFLLWRVVRRLYHGSAPKPVQHPALNVLSDIVRWALLASIVLVIVSGYLLPWSLGEPIHMGTIFDIPSPLSPSPALHSAADLVHSVSGHAFVPLVILHFAGIIKHSITKGGGYVMDRMVEPKKGGH
ncbi:MAG: cytochrome b/b6 domain-containing protein [Pseudomonadota bacterium]